jgi:hypothetical protein
MRSTCDWSSQGGKLPRCVLPRTFVQDGRIACSPIHPSRKWPKKGHSRQGRSRKAAQTSSVAARLPARKPTPQHGSNASQTGQPGRSKPSRWLAIAPAEGGCGFSVPAAARPVKPLPSPDSPIAPQINLKSPIVRPCASPLSPRRHPDRSRDTISAGNAASALLVSLVLAPRSRTGTPLLATVPGQPWYDGACFTKTAP